MFAAPRPDGLTVHPGDVGGPDLGHAGVAGGDDGVPHLGPQLQLGVSGRLPGAGNNVEVFRCQRRSKVCRCRQSRGKVGP